MKIVIETDEPNTIVCQVNDLARFHWENRLQLNVVSISVIEDQDGVIPGTTDIEINRHGEPKAQ